MKVLDGFAIDYMINAPCNLKCPFCYGPPVKLKGEISLEQKLQLVQLLSRSGIKKIVVAGGEPTLSKDLLPFLKQCKSYGIQVSLQTNAFYPDVLQTTLPYLDWIALPLDGISYLSQLSMRTSDKHLDNFLTALQIIEKYKFESNSIFPNIKVGTVISNYNINELESMAEIINCNPINIWKLYKIRERGKGIDFFSNSISDGIIESEISRIKIKYNSTNMYYSSNLVINDSYIIINPDSNVYVITGKEEYIIDKIFEKGDINETTISRAIQYADLNRIVDNVSKSFPLWQ